MRTRSIAIVMGTRPEAIKAAPVIKQLEHCGVEYMLIWSGQHYDYEMSKIFFDQLGLPKPDVYLDIAHGLDVVKQVSSIVCKLVKHINKLNPVATYALGDTNTTLATALASVYSSKPFIHDEAGMRSFDMSMLEEINRKIADVLAYLRLAPTKLAVMNMLLEGIPWRTIKLVGSTVVDALIFVLKNLIHDEEDILSTLNVEKGNYVLVTVHRRENLYRDKLTKIVKILK